MGTTESMHRSIWQESASEHVNPPSSISARVSFWPSLSSEANGLGANIAIEDIENEAEASSSALQTGKCSVSASLPLPTISKSRTAGRICKTHVLGPNRQSCAKAPPKNCVGRKPVQPLRCKAVMNSPYEPCVRVCVRACVHACVCALERAQHSTVRTWMPRMPKSPRAKTVSSRMLSRWRQ